MNNIIRVVMEICGKQEFLLNARGGNYFDTLAEANEAVENAKETFPDIIFYVIVEQ